MILITPKTTTGVFNQRICYCGLKVPEKICQARADLAIKERAT
jgi:hypothetical protein